MELLTFQEFADLAGISPKTVQRHVAKGKLQVHETPLGRRLSRTDVDSYLLLQPDNTGQQETGRPDLSGPHQTPADSVLDSPGQVHEPVQERFHSPDSQLAVPLAAHLAALELAARQLDQERERSDRAQLRMEQAERAKLELQFQLQRYQTVLSEQAESLTEERALRQSAETKLSSVNQPTPELQSFQEPVLSTPAPRKRGFWAWLRGNRAKDGQSQTG